MADPVDTAKRRRRWPWVALAALVLLIVGPIAWRFRPLNADERALVGHWQGAGPATQVWEFDADRRWRIRSTETNSADTCGNWTATSTAISFTQDLSRIGLQNLPWHRRVLAQFRAKTPTPNPIEWRGSDCFSFLGYEMKRVALINQNPDEPAR